MQVLAVQSYSNEEIFTRDADQALRDLNEVVEKMDSAAYSEKALLNSEVMQNIRQKADQTMVLIQASDGRESTVEILD